MVSWPWPWVTLPASSVTVPDLSKRISAPSKPAGSGALDGVGEADAAQLAVLARLRAPLLEAGEVGELERHVHALLELAAVVGEGERGLERHGLGRNVVLPPQLRGVDTELVGGEIDQPLDHIGRLGAAVAAIGPHRIGVGEHRGHVGVHGRDAIDAGQRADIAGEGLHAGLQVGADAGDDMDAHAEKVAVLVERELGLGDVVAGLRVAQERLRARGHPFHRAAARSSTPAAPAPPRCRPPTSCRSCRRCRRRRRGSCSPGPSGPARARSGRGARAASVV